MHPLCDSRQISRMNYFSCMTRSTLLLCSGVFIVGALLDVLLFHCSFLRALLPCAFRADSIDSRVEIYEWRKDGQQSEARRLLDALQETLATLQSTQLWNGTYWPETIQWVGAVSNTLVVASLQSLAHTLEDQDGKFQHSSTLPIGLQQDIQRHWRNVETYYDEEDTIQIYGAAYDDAQWIVLEWLEAIMFMREHGSLINSSQITSNIARFAHRAHIFYDIVQNEFNTSSCEGGITWNPSLAPYKNAITNELYLSSSIAMYLSFPGDNDTDPYPSPNYISRTNKTLPQLHRLAAHDPGLLENAKKEWAWFKAHNFTNAQGLIVDGFHIATNQTTCDERNEMIYTYNQGVLLSGLRGLWEATGEASYLSDGYDVVDIVIQATGWYVRNTSKAFQWAGLGRNGIMEDYCDAAATCSQDAQVFKGIFFHHLDRFCDSLPTSTPLIQNLTYTASVCLASHHQQMCQSYTPWVLQNAYAALDTKNSSGIIGGWWGAPHVNSTQQRSSEWSHPNPVGSWDVRSEPHDLDSVLRARELGNDRSLRRSKDGSYMNRLCGRSTGRVPYTHKPQGDRNDLGRGRTIETHASGLGVAKAAADFLLARESA